MSEVNHTLLRQLRAERKKLQARLDITPEDSAWGPNLQGKIERLTEQIEMILHPLPSLPADERPDPMPEAGQVWIHPMGYPVEVVEVVDPEARREDIGMRPSVTYQRLQPLDVSDQRLFGRRHTSAAIRFVQKFSRQS